MIYELLTGKMPFEAENVHQQYAMVVEGAAPPPSSHRAEVPVALDAIVLRCLEPKPEKRYPSVAELARDLAPFAPDHARGTAERVARVSTIPRIAASTPPPAPVSTPPMVSTRPDARKDETALIRPQPPRARVMPIAFGAIGGATAILALLIYTRSAGVPDTTGRAGSSVASPVSPISSVEKTSAEPTARASSDASVEPTSSAASAPQASAPIASARPAATSKPARPRPSAAPTATSDPLDLGHRK